MRDLLKFYRLSDATVYDRIKTIYQFIKPFLDKKYLFLRNMEPLINKPCLHVYLSKEDSFFMVYALGKTKTKQITDLNLFYYKHCICNH